MCCPQSSLIHFCSGDSLKIEHPAPFLQLFGFLLVSSSGKCTVQIMALGCYDASISCTYLPNAIGGKKRTTCRWTTTDWADGNGCPIPCFWSRAQAVNNRVTTHWENKFANAKATFSKHGSHSRKRPSHGRQTRRTQSQARQKQLANDGKRLYSNILAGHKLVSSSLGTATFGKQNSANSRATLVKRRNYKREIGSIHKLLQHRAIKGRLDYHWEGTLVNSTLESAACGNQSTKIRQTSQSTFDNQRNDTQHTRKNNQAHYQNITAMSRCPSRHHHHHDHDYCYYYDYC